MSNTWLRFDRHSMEDLQQFLLHPPANVPVSVHLKGDQWGPSACTLLAICSGTIQLRTLSICGTRIGNYGVGVLTGVGALAGVRTLSLERSGLTDRSVELLSTCPDLGALRELYLCNRGGLETGVLNAITDAGGVALATSPQLAELEVLDLWETDIGDATIDALLVSPGLPCLQKLNIWATRVTCEGVLRVRAINNDRWMRTRNDVHPATSCNILSDYDDRIIDYSADPSP